MALSATHDQECDSNRTLGCAVVNSSAQLCVSHEQNVVLIQLLQPRKILAVGHRDIGFGWQALVVVSFVDDSGIALRFLKESFHRGDVSRYASVDGATNLAVDALEL